MRIYILSFLFLLNCLAYGQQDSWAIEIASSDKGILLPRLADTGNVTNPEEGLMIYSLASKQPSYYNGNNWNALSGMMPTISSTDSITYKLSSAAMGLTTGTYPVTSLNYGMSGQVQSSPNFQLSDVLISLPKGDPNLIEFQFRLLTENHLGPTELEFLIFEAGASTPYYSVKLKTNIEVTTVQLSFSEEGAVYTLSLRPIVFGFKDWINDKSRAINIQTGVTEPY